MRRPRRSVPIVLATALGLVLGMLSPAYAEVLGGLTGSTLAREALQTPTDAASAAPDDLQYADPTAGLAGVDPPEPNSSGSAQLSYPIELPDGRGLTPELTLSYDSGDGSGWVGKGWSLGVGQVTVDTTFGVPKFCPSDTPPTCGDYESESYRLDGDLLMPTATTASPQPRVADRSDFTRKVETEHEQIIRHGDSPKNYFWEVRDKSGNVRWYGGHPDRGGPAGGAGTRTGPARNDLTQDPDAVLKDREGNVVAWYLTAERDVGVNMIRYEYDKQWYQPDGNGSGSTWVSEDACDDDRACAQHVHLSRILYTGSAEASGHPEDPGYRVDFVRDGVRPDPVIDASTGALDVDQEQLAKIRVRANDSGKLLTEYRLDFEKGKFAKQLLTSVTQIGCATGAGCDGSTAAEHTFDYFDDADGWVEQTTWTTGDDELDELTGTVEENAGALGMSSTVGGDGHIYLGFNPTSPTKLGSFGGALTFEGADTRSLSEFMDINGDSLPDKVFRNPDNESEIRYRLNLSSPSDPPDKEVEFSDDRVIDGLKDLPEESEFGVSGGVEAYFGIAVAFHAGGSWNWSDGYFSDVNGDGLPDFVKAGSVRFNRLECAQDGPCEPKFGEASDTTRLPLNVTDGLTHESDDTLADALDQLRKLSPPIDTVRRWVAPHDGTVTVDSTATLVAPKGTESDNRVAIQHNGNELSDSTLSAPGEEWQKTLDVDVSAGDRLYFRFSPVTDAEQNSADWAPTITYTDYEGDTPHPPSTDANGLSQHEYDASADFTLAGRPGGFVGMPEGGTVAFTGMLRKEPTSDDIRPTITHRFGESAKSERDESVTVTPVTDGGAVDADRQKSVSENDDGEFCVAAGDGTTYGCHADEDDAQEQLRLITTGETGLFRIEAEFSVDDPITDGNGQISAQDMVEARLAVDSPVDATALRWVEEAPRLCYLDAEGACDPGKPDVTPPVDTDIYPETNRTTPVEPWSTDEAIDDTASATINLADDASGGDVVLTVKDENGYVAKQRRTIPDGTDDDPDAEAVEINAPVSLEAGTDYWFDVSVRDPALVDDISSAEVRVDLDDDGDPDGVPSTLNATGRQGYFPLPYRGWGVAGYRGDGDRRTTAIKEADFRLSRSDGSAFEDEDEACQHLNGSGCLTEDDTDSLGFPDSYGGSAKPEFDAGATADQIEDVYSFLPTRAAAPDDPTAITYAWSGPKQQQSASAGATQQQLVQYATADDVGASVLGKVVPTVDASAGDIPAPNLSGKVSPSLSLTGGIGPASGSLGVGWSQSDVDYLDMNGDGFPDVVRPDSITYTDPRGGTACRQSETEYDVCTADPGLGEVNSDTTFAASGGFDGSPVSIKANSRGAANSTVGRSAGKSDDAAKGEYGAGITVGGSISASWTSPVVSSWDDSEYDADFGEVPGSPHGGDGTAPLQETLTDINGDGLPDKIRTTPKGVFVRLGLGYAFAPEVKWTANGFESGESYGGALSLGLGFTGYMRDYSGGAARNTAVNFPRTSWADVNGDGILDALHKSGDSVEVSFGTGAGIGPSSEHGATETVDFVIAGEVSAQTGDQVRQDTSVGYGGGGDVTMGFGPLCVAACYLIVNPGAHAEGSQTLTDVALTDVNGDGYADSVSRAAGDSELKVRLNTQGRTGLLKSVTNPLGGSMSLDYDRSGNTVDHPGSTWVMSSLKVDDGRPGDGPDVSASTFDYADPRYDFVHRTGLGFASVTERERNADGTKVLRTTRQTYRNDSVFDAGLLTSTSLYDGDAKRSNLVQRSTATWEVLDGESGDPLDAASLSTDGLLTTWATPRLVRSEDARFADGAADPGLRSATSYAYDELGNATRIVDEGVPGTAEDDVVARIRYSDCEISASDSLAEACGTGDAADHPAYWNDQLCPTWVSVPAAVTVTDADGTVLRHREGARDLCDNGAVTQLRELIDGSPDDGEFAETRLGFDDWGSYNRIVYPADEQDRHYAVYYRYDEHRRTAVAQITDYQLDAAEVDAFLDADSTTTAEPPAAAEHVGLTSHTTYAADTGLERSSTDPNGQTTAYAYDALGRLIRTTLPDGGSVEYEYHPTDPAYAYAVARHSDAFQPDDDTIDTVTFVDGTGRTTQQKREAELFRPKRDGTANTYVVSGAVTYDALGREVRQAYPTRATTPPAVYDPGDPDAPTTVKTYDVYDRETRSTSPSGNRTKTAYGFGSIDGRPMSTTTVTDPLDRVTRTTADVRGHTRAVDDIAVGQEPVRTSYEVDPLGQLLSADAAGARQVEHTYDLLGRRTSTSTQDGGTVEYGYDPAGNQITTQSSVQRADDDAKVHYSYAFGNLVEIDYPDATPDVSLSWGGYDGAPTAANGAGRLVEVTDAARHQTFEYDANGFRSAEVTAMVDDHWKMGELRTETTHDWLGRLGSISYPDGETVTHGYDRGGSLSSVRGSKSCTDLGRLATAADAAQSRIDVVENPLEAAPVPPFTISIGDERLRVTAREASSGDDVWTYTVERGINGTVEEPTAALHSGGASVTSDDPLTCRYRYLDDRHYDRFGATAFEQIGNGNRTRYEYYEIGRKLQRSTVTAPRLDDRVLQQAEYDYDRVGNVIGYTNALPEDTSNLMGGPSEQTYEYDGHYRLTHAEGSWDRAPHFTRHYTYDVGYDDATGNVVAKSQRDWQTKTRCKKKCKEFVFTDTTFDLGPVTYSPDHQHQVATQGSGDAASTLSYDLDGNVTQISTPDYVRELSWDGAGQLTTVVDRPNGTGGKPIHYAYDWQGRRAFERKEQGRSWFVNPYVTVKNGTMWKNYHADDQMIATKFSQQDAYEQKVYFQHRDLQGSTNIVTDRKAEVFQHHEYFPDGQVWVDEKSTIYRTPYQYGGDYVNEDHGLSDLGQRWYDSRRSMLYAVEPAVFSDPVSVVEEPGLAAPYTYAWSNPVSYTDPDGAMPTRVNPEKVKPLVRGLRAADGSSAPLSQQLRLQKFFRDHSGLRGRLSYSVLSRLDGARKLQKFSERFEMKPLVEFSLAKSDGGWQLQNVKLSWGYSKRAKLDFGSESPGGTSTPAPGASNPPPPPPPPPAGWKPTKKSPAATSPPVRNTSATSSSNGSP